MKVLLLKGLVVVCLCLGVQWSAIVSAADLVNMQQSTVHIFALVGNSGATGSGFLVGNGEYAVTNWHVVSSVEQRASLFVITSHNQKTAAQVVWHSAQKDLAILKLENGSAGLAVAFAPRSKVQVGENVYVMGFPGVVDSIEKSTNFYSEVTVTRGIVSREIKFENGIRYYQTDAAVNHGNSGGPLFNDKGQVIGIIAMKPVNREDAVEGIGFAIQCDELLPALAQLGLGYKEDVLAVAAPASVSNTPAVTQQPQQTQKNSGLSVLIMFLVLLVGIGIGLAVWLRRQSSAISNQQMTQMSNSYNEMPKPVVIGVTGQYAGQVIELSSTSIVIGRDPLQANVIFSSDITAVSRVHCIIGFESTKGTFWLEERAHQPSRNGTFLSSGERIQPGRRYTVRNGESFYLSDPGILFEVQLR